MITLPRLLRGRSPLWPVGLVAAVGLVTGIVQLVHLSSPPSTPPSVQPPVLARGSAAPIVGSLGPAVSITSPAATPPSTLSPESGVLRLPGEAPEQGREEFDYAGGRGPMLGWDGPVRHFKVAVEQGSGEDLAAFTAVVEATLGDERSWVGDGKSRLQRVSGREPADFTVYLATRDTAGEMCANGGTNIRVGGRPYTSCRTPGRAIINLDRWHSSAPPYLDARIPLATYRQYVINHEVGHEFGHHHEGCPKRGGPAPVMVQQTLTLRGCIPYAWPRRDGHRLAGPLL